MKRTIGLVLVSTLLFGARAAQSGDLVVVSGLGGDPLYVERFHKTALSLVTAARDAGLSEDHIWWLAEDPAKDPRIDGRSTAEEIAALLTRLAHVEEVAHPSDLWIVLIGHGNSRGAKTFVNLPGPDWSDSDFANALIALGKRRLVFVNTTSASGGFLPTLSAAGRAVVTATKSAAQRNETQFGDFFAEAFVEKHADADQDGQVSLLEAFEYSSGRVKRHYEDQQLLVTEQALLDDNGDRQGSPAPDALGGEDGSVDGALAARLFLGPDRLAGASAGSDSDRLTALQTRRTALNEQLDDLRRQKSTLDETLYRAELERLLIELALIDQQFAAPVDGDEGPKGGNRVDEAQSGRESEQGATDPPPHREGSEGTSPLVLAEGGTVGLLAYGGAPNTSVFVGRYPSSAPFSVFASRGQKTAQEGSPSAESLPLPIVAEQGPTAAGQAVRARLDSELHSFERSTTAKRKELLELLELVGRYEDVSSRVNALDGSERRAFLLVQARALAALGRDEEAETVLADVVTWPGSGGKNPTSAAPGTRHPDDLAGRLLLADLRRRNGRDEEADALYGSLIDAYNQRPQLTEDELIAVGKACWRLGRTDSQLFQDALRAFDEAAEITNAIAPRLLSAELFLEKYDSGEAKKSMLPIMETEPEHPEALLVAAKIAHFDLGAQAIPLAEQVLEVNPRHVDALVLIARMHLEVEDRAGARAYAARALAINPRSLEAQGALAAVEYLEGNAEDLATLLTAAKRQAPNSPVVPFSLSQAAMQNRLYPAALEWSERAVEADSQAWDSWTELGLNQLRLGRIEAGRASLERAFAGDPFNVWTKNTLDMVDKLQRFEARSSARFQVWADPKEIELLAPYALSVAERAFDVLQERFGYAPPTPLRVEVFSDHADFSVRTVGLAGLGALGVSFGPIVALDSPSGRVQGEFNWASTLWHEITHSFTLGMTGGRIPRWLTEGISVLEERRAQKGWGDDVSPSFLQAFRAGELLPLPEIHNGFVRPDSPDRLGLSYLQASMVCEMMEDRWGFQAVRTLLLEIGKGQSLDSALVSAIGVDAAGLDTQWRQWFENRFHNLLESFPSGEGSSGLTVSPSEEGANTQPVASRAGNDPATLEKSAQENPGQFRAQYRWGLHLAENKRLEEAEPFLRRAQELMPQFAGQNSPYDWLARLYRERGDAELEIEQLRGEVEHNERSLAAHDRLLELYRAAGDVGAEAELLSRKILLYPFVVENHQRLAQLLKAGGDRHGEIAELRAVAALSKTGRARAYYEIAVALEALGDFVGSRREVLRALELAPSYSAAQRLLLRLVERG